MPTPVVYKSNLEKVAGKFLATTPGLCLFSPLPLSILTCYDSSISPVIAPISSLRFSHHYGALTLSTELVGAVPWCRRLRVVLYVYLSCGLQAFTQQQPIPRTSYSLDFFCDAIAP